MLRNKIVRAEISFTCQIVNPYKAVYAANEYALNVLPPKFLIQARSILEAHSLSDLRNNREQVSSEIMESLSAQFERLGVRLESVTLGSLTRIDAN